MLLDTIGVILVYLACTRMGAGRVTSLLITAVWSVGLVSYEKWYLGVHQDHYTIFMTSFFAWALVNRTVMPRLKNDLILAVAGSLLVLQSTVALVAVPLTLVATLWISSRGIPHFVNLKSFLAVALLPVLIGGGLMAKNYANVGVPSSSSLGGQNMIQFTLVNQFGTWDHPALYQKAEQMEMPDWWLWCFRKAKQDYQDLQSQAVLYGQCFASPTGYDFSQLQDYLTNSGEAELAELVAQDQRDFEQRPWLFTGVGYESNTRFVAKYGTQSSRVWVDYLTHQPLDFLKGTIYVHQWFYVAGHTRLTGYPAMPELLQFSFKWVLRLAGLGTYLLAAGVVFYSLFSKKWNASSPLRAVGLIAFASVSTALLFNVTTCCENDRMYIQVTPYLVIVASYGASRLWAGCYGAIGAVIRRIYASASTSS